MTTLLTKEIQMESKAGFLYPFTVCSSCKQKFVVCLFVDRETNGSYPFANGLNRLNGPNKQNCLSTHSWAEDRLSVNGLTTLYLWSNPLSFNGQRIVGQCKSLAVNAVNF